MDASLRFERSLERIVTEHKFMWCEEASLALDNGGLGT